MLSRGSHIPMLVILLGALGGMAMSGIVGLFVGAVVLSLTYELLMVWLNLEQDQFRRTRKLRRTSKTRRGEVDEACF